MINIEDLKSDLEKYFRNQLSQEQVQVLLVRLEMSDETVVNRLIDEVLSKIDWTEVDTTSFRKAQVLDQVKAEINEQSVPDEGAGDLSAKRRLVIKYGFQAAAVLLICWSIFFYLKDDPSIKMATNQVEKQEITLPHHTVATLILETGKSISLDELKVGEVWMEDGIRIGKRADGRFYFEYINASLHESDKRQIFKTAKGSSSEIVLNDGSVVKLNSGTSISFPLLFEKIRQVDLHGEAYFEIVHNPQTPFRVLTHNSQIQVLGTKFNASAYPNEENSLITLREGSVLVSSKTARIKLIPGRQAIVNSESGRIISREVNLEEAIAWKDGYFKFTDQSIQEVLHELSKWYNIEGVDILTESSDRFSGSVRRSQKLSDLLNQLARISSLKFKIAEGRVKVTK